MIAPLSSRGDWLWAESIKIDHTEDVLIQIKGERAHYV